MWTAVIAGAAAGLASVPHCTAMCGPLAAYACSGKPGVTGQTRYQLGRFVSYSLLGAVAGTVGGATAVSLPHAWGSALLSWSLALGLGLAALRLWRRPHQPLVTLRAKQDEPSPTLVSRALGGLGRHPFFVGLGTSLLPCGALAAAVLIAASTGSTALGSLSMLAFAVVSGVGLVGASLVFARFARRPRPTTSRILAVVLALGSILFVIRPVHALRTGDTSSCHAPGSNEASRDAHHLHSHTP
ncbi:MAG: sulfite exporter TauE/SafE family protein [Deltaproteobacteria bacterium]|nr:sulfite exporter TauE/SafE family protein [Deltaproteobacteria bacterium]NND29056.1 sulfite exporter TauE/SafE family protein [Myxococcales bacterium]NNK07271.1 sulfite exporter TauE/SafE family protein [Myxococcales bacterium]